MLAADDVGAAGAGGEDRLGQEVGGGVAHLRASRDLLPDLELDRAARGAHAYDRTPGPDEVAAVERRQELHLLVAGEQALVAVGADRQLGDDVAEELEAVGTVDQVAAVVD